MSLPKVGEREARSVLDVAWVPSLQVKIILDNQRCPDVHKRLLLKGFIPFCLCPCFNLCDLGVFKMWLLY